MSDPKKPLVRLRALAMARVWLTVGLAVLVLAAGGGITWYQSARSRPGVPAAQRSDPVKGSPSPKAASPKGTPSVTGTASGVLAGFGALGPGAPTAPWVIAENQKPGTRAWVLTKPALHHEIEGYANAVSIDLGGSVNLYVSTTAPTYNVSAFRMGYYGGNDGRLVWTSPQITGIAQPTFTVTPGVNTVSDAWQPSLTVATDAVGWPQGDYLFLLTASTGYQSYIPLTIRDNLSTAAYLIDNDVTTWQAYNLYGGYDLYQGPKGYHSRSRIVSFDRPYTLGDGSGDFLGNELHVVALMESLGLDVAYSTSIDLDEQPDLVLAHRVFLSLGHDEYYSLSMRTALVNAIARGVNLVFFGANAIYRHIRLQPSPLGPDRLEVDYKNAAADPLYGHDNADVTPVAWRFPPNNLPESEIIGDYYQCNPVLADMVVADPSNWIFDGTGVRVGTHLKNLVGTEYDHYDPHVPGPTDVSILARSPLVCQGKPDYADMTYYTAASGAGVFASGTLNWVPMMVPAPCALPCPGPTVVRATENILVAFGSGPAGTLHPSVANSAKIPIPVPSLSPAPKQEPSPGSSPKAGS